MSVNIKGEVIIIFKASWDKPWVIKGHYCGIFGKLFHKGIKGLQLWEWVGNR